jgi:hypothetical protein
VRVLIERCQSARMLQQDAAILKAGKILDLGPM